VIFPILLLDRRATGLPRLGPLSSHTIKRIAIVVYPRSLRAPRSRCFTTPVTEPRGHDRIVRRVERITSDIVYFLRTLDVGSVVYHSLGEPMVIMENSRLNVALAIWSLTSSVQTPEPQWAQHLASRPLSHAKDYLSGSGL